MPREEKKSKIIIGDIKDSVVNIHQGYDDNPSNISEHAYEKPAIPSSIGKTVHDMTRDISKPDYEPVCYRKCINTDSPTEPDYATPGGFVEIGPNYGTETEQAYDIESMERNIHLMINKHRIARNMQILEYDERLAFIARKHSQDMIDKQYMSHDSPEGFGPIERARLEGYSDFKAIGENIFIASGIIVCPAGYDRGIYNRPSSTRKILFRRQVEIENDSVNGWMNIPGHRKNILSEEVNKEGIGIAIKFYDIHITEILAG